MWVGYNDDQIVAIVIPLLRAEHSLLFEIDKLRTDYGVCVQY